MAGLLARVCVLMLATLSSSSALAQTALPKKQSNAGDSISQAFGANSRLGDKPDLSWVQGTNTTVNSVFLRYKAKDASWTQQPESVSGAEMVGSGDSFAAQAQRICAQTTKPQVVSLLLGGNDVCNRPRASSTQNAATNMYSVTTFMNALRAGLDQLASCLPSGSKVHVLSVPRVDFLYNAGHAKSWWCPYVVWPAASICRIVTAENNAGRRAQIGARINEYNKAMSAEVAAYDRNANGKNPRGLKFVSDWQGSIEEGKSNTSIGSYRFGAADINGFDCFHPNTGGQKKLACAAWASNPDGSGTVPACLK